MGTFCLLSPELWPLIEVRNSFSLSIFAILLPIFFKLCMRVDIGNMCFGLQIDKFCHLIEELWPLFDVQNCFLLNIF